MTIEWMSVVASGAARVLVVVSIADLICGLVHWLEDSYGQERWPVIGPAVIAPNRLHHRKPRAFVHNTWWQSARYQVVIGVGVVLAALCAGCMSWELMLLIVVAANGNEVHKWAHRTRAENGRLINWLQTCRIVQTRRHHAQHHRGQRNSHYCTVTIWVNPIADTLGVWRFLEWCVRQVSGTAPVLEADDTPTRRAALSE